MNQTIYNEYLAILREELVPALGCTEPIAIALAAAKAREALGFMPEKIEVRCSGNIIKNAMGVVVPTTGNMKGVDTSAVLGAVAGNPNKGLEVLSDVQPQDIATTAQLLQQGICKVSLLETTHQLHIVIEAQAQDHTAVVEIRDTHTNIVRVERDGEALFTCNQVAQGPTGKTTDRSLLNLADILEFTTQVTMDEIEESIQRQIDFNTRIAQEGLSKPYGGQVGATLLKRGEADTDIRSYARALAAAGSDARMGGCVLPVIINSGSGNQGITVSLPVIAYAGHLGADHQRVIRALVLSNLVALLQKREIGRLSAYCGVVCAACGSGAAITWLHGGDLNAIGDTITNTLANVSGIVCDGAKGSCAAKIATSVDAAILGHEMTMNGNVFGAGEGIVKSSVEKTIQSVGQLAQNGMRQTDQEILRIMVDEK